MATSPATVILPVHNVERTIRQSLQQMLEAAESISLPVRLVVVDDGSTDDTYEIVCEISSRFPQVWVLRQPFQRGMGPALDLVRRRIAPEAVIVHDGVSPIDAHELAALLAETELEQGFSSSADDTAPLRRFSEISALNARMERAHRAATSLRWMELETPVSPRRMQGSVAEGAKPDSSSATPLHAITPSLSELPLGAVPVN